MPSVAFTLANSTPTPPPAVIGEEHPYATSVSAADVVLGRGLMSLFQRDGRGDFANTSGASLVRSNIEQILGTVAASGRSSGELPWKPEFGSLTHMLKHANNDDVVEALATEFVVSAIEKWESRVRVKQVRIERDVEAGTVDITIAYDVVSRRRKTPISTGHKETFSVSV